ncbi:D-alanyl-D-alanine carboxypeptidase family protein [Streptomonospora algeriensis]|uniref:D-alanyl-D-alanine carboxypeptidase family protein n=1 Tax=Streptomonospora algeriensis TaxID=995084 RepID=A0ABW3BCB3_9ACTN
MPFFLDSTRTGRVQRIGSSLSPLLVRARKPAVLSVIAVLMTALLLVPGAETALAPVTSPASADSDVDALKKKADKAKEDLEKATDEYTNKEDELNDAQDELVSTLHDLQQTELRLAGMREPLARLGGTLYMQPNAGVLGILTSGKLNQDLEVEAHVLKLSDDREAMMDRASDLREKQSELATQAQELQTQTQLKRVQLEEDLESLRAQSEESTDKLTQELKDRGLDPEAYFAGVECDPSVADNASGHPNGLLPQNALCGLHQDGESLRADAAVDFLEMNKAYTERFGEGMCLTSSYRDLSKQQQLYATKPPGMAAVPGTSNHGWGLAVDLCGGVQNQGSPQFNWLEENSRKWNWFHPQWAYSNPFEPWHWEHEADHG